MSEKNEWKRIESAPKDGSEFLACYTRQGNVTQIVKWNTLHGHFSSKGEWLPGFTANATHWMPLPAAPGSTSSAPGDAQDGWRIDNSAGRPILVRNNCSVIEAEDAEYVLRLIAADRTRAPTFATSIFGERIGQMMDGSDAPAAGDALDAARYRWLRDHIQEDHSLPGSFWLSDTGGESWDKTIDAAMDYQRQQGAARC